MRQDSLADVMSAVKNAEKIGRKECITPASNLIREVLKIIQKNNYIGSFEFVDDGKSGKFRIELINRVNNCNVIKPRYSVKADSFEKFEKRFLPARGFGILIVSTTSGVMTHEEAKTKKIGGKLVAFIY